MAADIIGHSGGESFWHIRTISWALMAGFLLAEAAAVHGQTHEIDSLRALLGRSYQEDTATVLTLQELSASYWQVDLDSSEAVARRLIALSEKIGYPAGISIGYGSLGVCQWYRNNYFEALAHHERALEAAIQAARPQNIARVHHNIGLVYDEMGDHQEAMRHYVEALKLFQSSDDRQRMASAYNVIGGLFSRMDDKPAALEEYRKARAIRESIGDGVGLSETYGHMGVVLSEMGHQDSALYYFGRSLALARELGHNRRVASNHTNIGKVFIKEGGFRAALAHMDSALSIYSGLGDRRGMSIAHINIGRVHADQGKDERALEHIRKASALAEEVGAMEQLIIALRGSSEILARIGRHREAYADRLRYEALNDSIHDREKMRSVTRIRMEHEFQRQRLLDSLATAEATELASRDHALQLAAERNRRTLITLGALLVLVVAGALWSRLRYMRRARDTILRTQEQLLASEKQREAEQVRTRIARDIHDEIGGELTRIRMFGQEVRHLMTHDQTAAGAMLDRMGRSAREANGALRDIVWATDPKRDTMHGLVEHLREIAHRQLEPGGTETDIRVHHAGNDLPVDPAWRAHVLRIVKEALNNAVKYAGAKSIALEFATEQDSFKLRIADDGKGFDPADKPSGNGLSNMRARAEAIGAELGIISAPGIGCVVEVEGPLPTAVDGQQP
ncbi:MAG: sensor histidine kinase [Flavobacteriales bacterium]|nr:sensor histidine kinase [Flavobacteriales bacterium]